MSKRVSSEAFKEALDAELRRRLAELGDGGDDTSVGRFTFNDWVLIGLLFIVVPLGVTWWLS